MDPLSYGIDGLRSVLTGASAFGMVTDIAVLSIVALALASVGSYFFSKIQL